MSNETERSPDGQFVPLVAESNAKPGGRLVPLKTTLETRAREKLVDVYISSVPVRQANGTLDVIRKLLDGDGGGEGGGLDLQHLRRFAKYHEVPEHVCACFSAATAMGTSDAMGTAVTAGTRGTELFLLIGSANAVPEGVVVEALSGLVGDPKIRTIRVPLLAPTSVEQARSCTERYWPTVYKKSNPFGPHPSIVARAEEEIAGDVERWMDLAEEVGREASTAGVGEGLGVVIVERKGGVARALAVAGDARWMGWARKDAESGAGGGGNVTAHAAMRAIGMVAKGLRLRDPSADPGGEVEIFQDRPVLPLEKEHYDTSGYENGYLCHDLEIYCTHEPCIMCSMAIVHSRFGRLVFGRRMRMTGGVCADTEDGGLGCGLWWRKELNWTMLTWQFVRKDAQEQAGEGVVSEDLNC